MSMARAVKDWPSPIRTPPHELNWINETDQRQSRQALLNQSKNLYRNTVQLVSTPTWMRFNSNLLLWVLVADDDPSPLTNMCRVRERVSIALSSGQAHDIQCPPKASQISHWNEQSPGQMISKPTAGRHQPASTSPIAAIRSTPSRDAYHVHRMGRTNKENQQRSTQRPWPPSHFQTPHTTNPCQAIHHARADRQSA